MLKLPLNAGVKRLLFKVPVVGAAGVFCGQSYKNCRDHPGYLHRFLKYSFFGGICGGMVGLTVGLLSARRPLFLAMSQSMYWSCATFYFSNIRSLLENAEITLPGKEESIKPVVIDSVTSGLCFGTIGYVTFGHPVRALSFLSGGIVVGFLGHYIYEELRVLRLEFLLRVNHPELLSKKYDADAFIKEQVETNPNYTGPRQEESRITQFLLSIWNYHQTANKEAHEKYG